MAETPNTPSEYIGWGTTRSSAKLVTGKNGCWDIVLRIGTRIPFGVKNDEIAVKFDAAETGAYTAVRNVDVMSSKQLRAEVKRIKEDARRDSVCFEKIKRIPKNKQMKYLTN